MDITLTIRLEERVYTLADKLLATWAPSSTPAAVEKPKEVKAAAPPAAAEKAEKPAEAVAKTELTLEALQGKAVELKAAKGAQFVKDVLQECGVKSISAAPTEKYEEIYNGLNKELCPTPF